jgi:hypothetical protein
MDSPPPKPQAPPASGKQKKVASGKPPPQPASCGKCKSDEKKDGKEADAKKQSGSTDKAGKNDAGKTDPGDGADKMTVNKLIDVTGKIGKSVLEDSAIKGFQSTAKTNVIDTLEKHARAIDKELDTWFPAGEVVVRELRGTTEVQGRGYRADPELAGSKGLDERITRRLRKGWSMPSTIRTRHRAPRSPRSTASGRGRLSGPDRSVQLPRPERTHAAALLLCLPARGARSHAGKELLEIASVELSGNNRKKFEALIGVDSEGKWLPAVDSASNYNGIKLDEAMKSARDTEGEKGWDKAGKALQQASRTSGTSALAGNDDPFNLASGKTAEARKAHDQAEWEKVQIAHGRLTGAVAASKDPQAIRQGKDGRASIPALRCPEAIYDQATKTIVHHHHVSDPEGMARDWDTTDEVDPRFKLDRAHPQIWCGRERDPRAAPLGISTISPAANRPAGSKSHAFQLRRYDRRRQLQQG